jgi:subtilase family serine protease
MAMAADAFSGAYNVYAPNIPGVGDCSAGCAIGGTSEASPLATGSYARILSSHANGLGNLTIWLYIEYAHHANDAMTPAGTPPTQQWGAYHDIVTGANGAYTALPGFDYTTGVSTFDIALLDAQIRR